MTESVAVHVDYHDIIEEITLYFNNVVYDILMDGSEEFNLDVKSMCEDGLNQTTLHSAYRYTVEDTVISTRLK